MGFQPGMAIGVQQAGVTEVIERVPVHKVEYQEVRRQVPIQVPVQQIQVNSFTILQGNCIDHI